jgi:predicted porin
MRRTNEGSATRPKSDLWYIGASVPVTSALTVDGHLARLGYRHTENADSTLLALRALYKLSKRTTVYAQVGTIRNNSLVNVSVSSGAAGSNPVLGGSQTATTIGMNHAF